ncbi:signal peptide peptidase SppA [Streptobacillus moniliformis]|uniref:signal peptide peptidase SppA n=1 Tax=Streptobacillus moniliformis TaxID=34105 RepID=UPI0007E39569|nr:signal peptide peptidase SppA [Streptobacillus moniliformis]
MTLIYYTIQAIIIALILSLVIIIVGLIIKSKIKKDKNISDLKLKKIKKLIISNESLLEDVPEGGLNKKNSFFDFKEALKKINQTETVEEVILDVDKMELTAVQIDELKDLFKDMNKNKKVIALASNLDNIKYRIAMLADTIYMYNSLNSSMLLKGYSRSFIYFKKLFDKIGVKVNVLHIGDYKSAGENYHKEEMSEEQRTSITRIYDKMLENFIDEIKDRRNVDIKEKLLNGDLVLINHIKAKEYGLIDGISNLDKLEIDYSKDTEELIPFSKKVKVKNKSKNVIGVICAEGAIMPNNKSESIITYDDMLEKIESLQEIKNLKGVILRINSPGGSALESERIYKELKNLDVPIFISMSSVAASGGYYISTVAKKVFLNPSTITGSIGVVSMYPTFDEISNKVGLNIETVNSGVATEIFDLKQPLTDELREKLIQSMRDVYIEFKKHVMTARVMTDERLEKIAQGKIWLGNEAVEIGLADKIGGFDDCLKALLEYLNIKEYKLHFTKRKISLVDSLKNNISNIPFTAEISNELNMIQANKYKPMYFMNVKIDF